MSVPCSVSANSIEREPQDPLSPIIPPSIQRQHGTARFPPYTKEEPSSTKRSQERGQPHRSNAGRPGLASLATERWDPIVDLANTCSFDLKKPGTQWYVYKVFKRTCLTTFPHNPDNIAHDLTRSGIGAGQDKRSKSSDHTVELSATDENGSNWESTMHPTTKLAINLVEEPSDAVPLLESVAGSLSAILDHCDV